MDFAGKPSESLCRFEPTARVRRWLLVAILLAAAGIRLWNLEVAPPGLNQDEAANAWNAWCLLKTGQDQHGVRWPVFYLRCFGENRSPLYVYFLIPFQAVSGLNVVTTRMPNAVAGVVVVGLLYYIGRRLFGGAVGLLAALLLAVTPWHIQLSRTGHEGGLVPLLVVGPLAAMLWANMPPFAGEGKRPSGWIALFAGLLTGAACYGYPAVRFFVPLLLMVLGLFAVPSLLRAGSGRGRWAAGAFAVGLAATLGPLVYQHIFHSDEISRRMSQVWVWNPEDSLGVKVAKAASRYLPHFESQFLFERGDDYLIQAPPVGGELHSFMLPLLLAGVVFIVPRLGSCAGSRLLIAWIVLFPMADVLFAHNGPHALRSGPGVAAAALLAAVGGAWLAQMMWRWGRGHVIAAGAVLAVAMAVQTGRVLQAWFGAYNKHPFVRQHYQADLVEALTWLRPRVGEADAIFISGLGHNLPYIVALVVWGYEPAKWFAEPRELLPNRSGKDPRRSGEWEIVTQFGKVRFFYEPTQPPEGWNEVASDEKEDRVYIVSPPQLPQWLLDPSATTMPAYEVRREGERIAIQVFERRL